MINHKIPFTPCNITLQELLRTKYITSVSRWLLGKNQMSILAQTSESAWESALTVITLSEVSKILNASNEELELRKEITRKSILVADWLLSKKKSENNFAHWENVTWDTSVIIQALLIVVTEYEKELSDTKIKEIETVVVESCKWLYYKFNQWDNDVKYPFGAADVAKLVLTFTKLYEVNKKLYLRMQTEYKEQIDNTDDGHWLSKIVEHLLQGKTEEISIVINNKREEEILTYWWDDYFTTAEVAESLAIFYDFCSKRKTYKGCNKKLLDDIKHTLIKACMYFEQGQIDGMWGSHIDTIKVINSYVLIRRFVQNSHNGKKIALIEPEIHTVFKGLRWMCDEKQCFSDGSFMHTMFLTVFFASALVEVYKSWEPAKSRVDEIYDDVVWAAPVRTTPERIKRLSVEIKNSNLEEEIINEKNNYQMLKKNTKDVKYKMMSTILILSASMIIFPIVLYIGYSMLGISTTIDTDKIKFADFLAFLPVALSIIGATFTAIIKRNAIANLFKNTT